MEETFSLVEKRDLNHLKTAGDKKIRKNKDWRLLRSDTTFLAFFEQRKRREDVIERLKNAKEAKRKEQIEELRTICAKFKVAVPRKFERQIGKSEVEMRFNAFSLKQLKAMCRILQKDRNVTSLDLSGNDISYRKCQCLRRLLVSSTTLTKLILCGCHVNSETLYSFVSVATNITYLNLSDNHISDRDIEAITQILQKFHSLKYLSLDHNVLERRELDKVGKSIGSNKTLEELNLSWNKIRLNGAVDILRGVRRNSHMKKFDISWNGLGFEGCVALAEVLTDNTSLVELNVSSSRIHPPGLLEMIKGLTNNKTLKILDMSKNPITPMFTAVLLDNISNSQESILEKLILKDIVINEECLSVYEEIRKKRNFKVIYELSLPVRGMNIDKMTKEVQAPSMFNQDPLQLLYMLKEKNRAKDFFNRINKDHNDVVSPDELWELFKDCGIPVTAMVIDTIMKFMDTDKDGSIDISEFLEGDKKIRKISRDQAKDKSLNPDEVRYTKYSRSFKRGQIDPMTFRLKIKEEDTKLSKLESINDVPMPDRKLSLISNYNMYDEE